MRVTGGSLEEADATALRRRAMDLLARREHGREELARKLMTRGASPAALAPVLDALEADGLLSDERFVASFVRQQLARGKGPLAIEHGLRERGVAPACAAAAVAAPDEHWADRAHDAREQRFGREAPRAARDRARQARFLQGRGFTGEQILRALAGRGGEDGG